MGGNESKGSDTRPIHFTDDEKPMVSVLFHRISHGKKTFNREQFKNFAHGVLDPEICELLYELLHGAKQHHHHHHLRGGHHEGEVDHHHFSHHLAAILKGGVKEQAVLLGTLCSPDHDYVIPEHLVKFTSSMVRSYEKILAAHCREYQSWMFAPAGNSYRKLALYMLEDLFCTGSSKDRGFVLPEVPKDVTYSTDEIETWISRCSLFQQIFHEVFHACFRLYETDPSDVIFHPRIPQVCDTNWSRVGTILDLPTILFLNATLPAALQGEWRLLFSNSLHGDSFTQLTKSVDGRGPTLLIVRDRHGYVFGGFASQPWSINSKFYGDDRCFLFRSHPNYGIYMATGYNNNFMYLNLNMQTLPNGMGMGGQFDYFGLWIDHSFSSGHSKAGPRCTTYGSPQLSESPQFEVDVLEVWTVGPQRKKEDEDDDEDLTEEERELLAKKSVLDKDPESKAMLELLGRGPVSEGLREGDETASSPENNKVISLF